MAGQDLNQAHLVLKAVLSARHTPGPHGTTKDAGSCLGHAAPRMEMRIEGWVMAFLHLSRKSLDTGHKFLSFNYANSKNIVAV